MSLFGIGAAAGATGTAATVGTIAVAGVAGAIAAGAIAVGGTQVAANVTQPDAKKVNIENVSAPSYAE